MMLREWNRVSTARFTRPATESGKRYLLHEASTMK
jgi:hypothetical protein